MQMAHEEGTICLLYLDETGFSPWSPVSYSYVRRGEQKALLQTARRGRRVNLLGLQQPDGTFDYGLVVGSISSPHYVTLMEWQAQKAQHRLAQTGRKTIVVQDNCRIHTCKAVQARQAEWEKCGLYMYFLPPYCSELNPVECEWRHLKADELAGRMFEDECDLADAVMAGVDARARRGG